MQRYDYFLRQKLTEGELDESFDAVENAIAYLAASAGVYGLAQNGEVTEKSGTPNMSVDVAGPLVAYDEDGQRIAVAALTNVDVSVDENSASTTVITVGHERYISVFVKYARELSNPRLDGAGDTVFYDRAESYEFVVVQGASAPAGTASQPALRASHILLADILIAFGQTSVLNADIDTDRTQYMVTLTGSPKSVQARTDLEAMQLLEDQINDIINGVVTIAASSVTYNGSGNNWADSSAVVAANVEAALDEVVTDLAAAGGAGKIGFTAVGTIAAGTVQAAIAELDSELSDAVGVGACGATKVGFAPQGTIAAATVEGAIVELDTQLSTFASYSITGTAVASGSKFTLTELTKNGAFVLASNEVQVPAAGTYEISYSGALSTADTSDPYIVHGMELNNNAVGVGIARTTRIGDVADLPSIAGSIMGVSQRQIEVIATPASEKLSLEAAGGYAMTVEGVARLTIRRIL